jgi:SAM-dependent methyltransferase
MSLPDAYHDLPVWTYDADPHIAELYDQTEDSVDDVEMIRSLLGQERPLRIFEPFCGSGRIFLPLAQDGHYVTGMDCSTSMLQRARAKIEHLPAHVQPRLIHDDVLRGVWPPDQDVTLLGGNCFYCLATESEQELCVELAARSLRPGGHVWIDHDSRLEQLSASLVGPTKPWPEGTCIDGTGVHGASECVAIDSVRNYWYGRRALTVVAPDGQTSVSHWRSQTHFVSAQETQSSLQKHGFRIVRLMDGSGGEAWTAESGRATFWARLESRRP